MAAWYSIIWMYPIYLSKTVVEHFDYFRIFAIKKDSDRFYLNTSLYTGYGNASPPSPLLVLSYQTLISASLITGKQYLAVVLNCSFIKCEAEYFQMLLAICSSFTHFTTFPLDRLSLPSSFWPLISPSENKESRFTISEAPSAPLVCGPSPRVLWMALCYQRCPSACDLAEPALRLHSP